MARKTLTINALSDTKALPKAVCVWQILILRPIVRYLKAASNTSPVITPWFIYNETSCDYAAFGLLLVSASASNKALLTGRKMRFRNAFFFAEPSTQNEFFQATVYRMHTFERARK